MIEVDLLVRACRHTHAPTTAGILINQDDSVFIPLIDRPRRAGSHAGWVQAVFTNPRQVEHEGRLNVGLHLGGDLFQDRIPSQRGLAPAKIIIPVWSPGDSIDVVTGDLADRTCNREILGIPRGAEQLVVLIRPRFVVVVQHRHARGRKNLAEDGESSPRTRHNFASLRALPPATPFLLVLPLRRIATTGAGLNIVEPHVLSARAVRPCLLAGNRTGVAPNALVQVHYHRDLSHDFHQYVTSWLRLRIRVTSSRWLPVGPT